MPAVDGGRYPAKRCVGDAVTVEVDIFRDGHELLRGVVRYRRADDAALKEAELHRIDAHLGGVRWAGEFEVDRTGRWEYTVQAWTDVFGTWRDELARKLDAGQTELAGELSEGTVLLETALPGARTQQDRALIEHAITTLQNEHLVEAAKHDTVLGKDLFAAVERSQERVGAVALQEPLRIEVDRPRARFGAWYEMFPDLGEA